VSSPQGQGRVRAAAGALSIRLALAAGFAGFLLMLAVDVHAVLSQVVDSSTAASAAGQLTRGKTWKST